MDTPEARALAQARAHAQATLARYTGAGAIDRTDAYWAGALAEALRILLNATQPEGGGPCPATSPTRYRHATVSCTLSAGHEGDHEARGAGNPAPTWPEGGEITWPTEPEGGES